MSQGIVNVRLYRDGVDTPWGFRLLGGADVGMPLTIQRVFLGSPSEGELHRGDVILRVGNRDSGRLTHQEAHDIIKNAGNNITLVVQRTPGAPMSPVPSPSPMSPIGISTSARPQTASPLSFASQTSSPAPSAKYTERLFKPLPKTQFPDSPAYRGSHAPEPHLLDSVERQEYMSEKEWEKQAITAQPYRSSTLITPKAKPRHDMPVGSYLRHVQDPSWKKPPPQPVPANKITEALMIATKDGGGVRYSPVSMSPGRTPTPDSGVQLVHRQYNSPLPIYSTESVAQALADTAGVQPGKSPVANSSKPNKGLPVGFHQIASKSPTYQLIQEQEWKKVKESKPAPVYVVPSTPDQISPQYNLPKCNVVYQTPSFNTLMRNYLVSPPK